MNVVHFGYSDLLPGAPRASYRLHEALARIDGVRSTMVVAKRHSADQAVVGPSAGFEQMWSRAAISIENQSNRLVRLSRNRTAKDPEISLAVAGSRLAQQVASLQPDIVQLHWLCGGLVTPEGLRSLRRFPLVWRFPDVWPVDGLHHYPIDVAEFTRLAPSPEGFLDRWLLRRKSRSYAALPELTIVSPTQWLADIVRRSPVFQDRRVEVIPTGIDLDVFRPQNRADSRALLGLPSEERIIMFATFAATDKPRKGFQQLVEALGHFRRSKPDGWRLVVMGGHPVMDPPDVGPVTWLGHESDERRLVHAYSAADVFVAPSTRENLANTVLEALACGTPVVAFSIGGMPEAVEHLANGYLASEGDSADLARGIQYVLDANEDAYQVLSENARKKAERDFEAARQARRYLSLYRELVESHSASPKKKEARGGSRQHEPD